MGILFSHSEKSGKRWTDCNQSEYEAAPVEASVNFTPPPLYKYSVHSDNILPECGVNRGFISCIMNR